jgi:two-component system nitrogen regulation response regulator GlnG
VLSDGQFYRVGGHQPLKANVRVIAATHQNLEERVRQGVFREDLFHRLNVIRLRLPPLRERREDIPMLTRFFLVRSAKELGVDAKRISEAALQRLVAFDFPGNVRQLENVCHWITVMAPAQVVEVDDLPPELQPVPRPLSSVAVPPSAVAGGAAPFAEALAPALDPAQGAVPPAVQVMPAASTWGPPSAAADDWVAGMEREVRALLASGQEGLWDSLTRRFEARMITAALDVTRGRRIEAAQRLGIGRNTITRKIQELGLDAE